MNYGKCPVCRGKISEEIIEYHDYEWQHTLLFDALEIRYCYECGFGFSAPDLALKDIERFYSIDKCQLIISITKTLVNRFILIIVQLLN